MAKRKSLSKTIRFEVFKRDSFTCQYCGKSAPDVVLEVDHIKPVSGGGDNDIMNLVTSCWDCNRGKGAKELSDNQIIKKQQEQLAELNEKRMQMEMMLEWRKGLHGLDESSIDAVQDVFRAATKSTFTDQGRVGIKKLIKRFGLNVVLDATQVSLDSYYDKKDEHTLGVVFGKIGGIAYNMTMQKSDPMVPKKNYIRGIVRNRHNIYDEGRLWKMLHAFCIDDENADVISNIAKYAKNWTAFWNDICEYYGGEC